MDPGGSRVTHPVPNAAPPTRRTTRNARHLLPVLLRPTAIARFLTDRRAPIFPKLLLGGAVLYLLLPLDLIPDIAPILGWLDDAGLIGIALAWLVSAVGRYEADVEVAQPAGVIASSGRG